MKKWTLGQIVAYFKYQSTKRINAVRHLPGVPIFQRSYYERVIRSDRELFAVRQYIRQNPENWEVDPEHVQMNDSA